MKNSTMNKMKDSFKKGQMFESNRHKVIITKVTENDLELTILDSGVRKQKKQILKSKNGETIERNSIDNSPKLTNKIRIYKKETFAKFINNNTFAPTRLGRFENFPDLKKIGINRYMV